MKKISNNEEINEKGMLHTKDGQSANLDGTKRVMIRGEEINVQRYRQQDDIIPTN